MDRGWTIFLRVWGAVALAALVGVCVSDFYTDFWVEHAMLTAVVGALLVAAVLAAIVDRYLERRDMRRWQLVAGVAVGEFAFAARWLRRLLLDLAGLPAADEAQETLALLARPDGAARCSAAIDALAHDPEGRARLFARLKDPLDHNGEVLGRWAPLMVQGEHAARLNEYVALAARAFKLIEELSREQTEHRDIPLGEDWVAGRIAKLIDLAAHLEVEFTKQARALTPLQEWIGAPEWFRPPTRTPVG